MRRPTDFHGYTEKDIAQLVLADLERRRDFLTAKMDETRQLLNGHPAKHTRAAKAPVKTSAPAKKKRTMTAEGRAAVVLAQKKRWAKVHREKKLAAAKHKAKSKPKEKPAAE